MKIINIGWIRRITFLQMFTEAGRLRFSMIVRIALSEPRKWLMCTFAMQPLAVTDGWLSIVECSHHGLGFRTRHTNALNSSQEAISTTLDGRAGALFSTPQSLRRILPNDSVAAAPYSAAAAPVFTSPVFSNGNQQCRSSLPHRRRLHDQARTKCAFAPAWVTPTRRVDGPGRLIDAPMPRRRFARTLLAGPRHRRRPGGALAQPALAAPASLQANPRWRPRRGFGNASLQSHTRCLQLAVGLLGAGRPRADMQPLA